MFSSKGTAMEPWLVVLIVIGSVIALVILMSVVIAVVNIVGPIVELFQGLLTHGMSDYAWERSKVRVERRNLANKNLTAADLAEIAYRTRLGAPKLHKLVTTHRHSYPALVSWTADLKHATRRYGSGAADDFPRPPLPAGQA
jgi:hypothetical protein